MQRLTAAAGTLVLFLAAPHVLAQPTTPGVVRGDKVLTDAETQQLQPDPKPPLSILPASAEDNLIDPRMARSWASAPSRLFVATTVDVGFIYLRPRVSFGYGKPFTSWIGFDANPIAQSSGLGAYAGLRIEIPFVDVRIGPRFFYSFNRAYLPVKESYDRLELEQNGGKQTQILTYETELDAAIPVGPGSIILRGTASYLTNIDADQAGFEETLHVVARPPWVLRGRLGYALRFGSHDQHSIGLIGEVLDVPKRDDSITVRGGPTVRFVLSRRVELRGLFVVPLVSPDRIGIIGGDFGELGVRYRWATE